LKQAGRSPPWQLQTEQQQAQQHFLVAVLYRVMLMTIM
jgi:hypothetical protein